MRSGGSRNCRMADKAAGMNPCRSSGSQSNEKIQRFHLGTLMGSGTLLWDLPSLAPDEAPEFLRRRRLAAA